VVFAQKPSDHAIGRFALGVAGIHPRSPYLKSPPCHTIIIDLVTA
jgi:hypothetical protein